MDSPGGNYCGYPCLGRLGILVMLNTNSSCVGVNFDQAAVPAVMLVQQETGKTCPHANLHRVQRSVSPHSADRVLTPQFADYWF